MGKIPKIPPRILFMTISSKEILQIMNEEYLLNYINYQKDKFKDRAFLWKMYPLTLLFGPVAYFYAHLLNSSTMKHMLIGITVPILIYIIIVTIYPRKDFLMLAFAFSYTNNSMIFIILMYGAMLSVKEAPVRIIWYMIATYMLVGVTSAVGVMFFIKKDKYATMKKHKPIPFSVTLPIAATMNFVAREILSQVEYNAVLLILICGSFFAYVCACMMHLYFCFACMRRYKIK
jgi:hypothetical protein